MRIFNMYIPNGVIYTFLFIMLALFLRKIFQKRPARATDKRKLSSEEKKIFLQAKIALRSSPKKAASLFESINLYREAIDALEQAGFIQDAADVLFRMGVPERAGVILVRNKKYKEAMGAFNAAKKYDFAAKAAKKGGLLDEAAKFYEKSGMYAQAAECYVEVGNHSEAAKKFIQAGQHDKALELYPTILDSVSDLSQLSLNKDEIKLIKSHVASGNGSADFAEILVRDNSIGEVIQKLIHARHLEKAIAL